MAGGKQSPRQKMVNLMYLVFISMLALNMSKEVLSAFGIMNEKLEASNVKATENNLAFLEGLATKAEENEAKFGVLYGKAKEIKTISKEYFDYLEGIKTGMMKDVKDKKDYPVMDKTDYLDNYFFQGDGLSKEGKEFLGKISSYHTKVGQILPQGAGMDEVRDATKTRFATGDKDGKVERRDGIKVDWMNYTFKGYPLVASLASITAMQADVKATEQDAIKAMLQGTLTSEISLTNFKTSLDASKSAFYAGEKYDGKIVISKTDGSSTPVKAELKLDGRKLSEGKDYKLEAGGIKMLISAGSPGDHKLEGTMYFQQDGEEVPVEVNNSFATISKPNAAVISADKMNVVYRGVANPMTVSIPGIPDNKVSAKGPGLSKRGGSKYVMNPGKGRTVTIVASGTLPDGQGISTKSQFRIKDIPRPSGTIRGQANSAKMPKKNIEISTIGAALEDFDFDINIAVSEFKLKVPGQPTVIVRGNKMDSRAKSALKRAGRGDAVQIFDIRAYITNNKTYKLKKVSPVVVELTN